MPAGVRCRIGLIVLIAGATAGDARPVEPSAATEVRQILEIAWKPSADNYAAAKQHYEAAKEIAPTDVRVFYAMTLAALKNTKPSDALQYLDQALQNGNPPLLIRRVSVWQKIVNKDRQATVHEVHDLARILAVNDALANQASYQESAHWLGIVLGYFGEPGSADMPAADLGAMMADVKSQLTGPLAKALADGEADFQQQFGTVQQQTIAAHNAAKLKNAARKAIELQKIDAQIAQEKENGLQAQNKLQQVREENKAAELEAMCLPIMKKIDDLKHDPYAKKGGKGDDKTEASEKYDSDQQEIRELQQQLAQYSPQIQKIQGLSAPLLGIINRELIVLRSLENKRREFAKPPSDADNETNAWDAKLKSISTYVGIDLEQEKKRILDSYGH